MGTIVILHRRGAPVRPLGLGTRADWAGAIAGGWAGHSAPARLARAGSRRVGDRQSHAARPRRCLSASHSHGESYGDALRGNANSIHQHDYIAPPAVQRPSGITE
jgi:hypothetical protein